MTHETAADATANANHDPLNAVADAMQAAAATVSDGATAARQAAEKALPSVGLFANRFLYTSSYAVSYGVVVPLALIALSVPHTNPFVHGLVDGSRAARDKVDALLSGKPATSEVPAT